MGFWSRRTSTRSKRRREAATLRLWPASAGSPDNHTPHENLVICKKGSGKRERKKLRDFCWRRITSKMHCCQTRCRCIDLLDAYESVDVQMDGWMDGRTDGRTDG